MCVLITVSQFLLLLFFYRVYPSEKMKIGDNFCWKYYYKSTTILSTLEYSFSIIGQSDPTRLNSVFFLLFWWILMHSKTSVKLIKLRAPELLLPHKQVDNDCYLYHFINMHSTSKKYTTLIMILFKLDFVFLLLFGHHVSQCGNSIMFLSFRFYVKSILENLEVLKLPFCHFWGPGY